MSSLDVMKDQGYKTVDFFLTMSCNKSCHYCTQWTLDMRNLEVDMDFLKEVLDYFDPHLTRINLLGGEPGLIKNLPEVVAEIKKHKNFIPSILSNSLVRRKHPWVLEDPDIWYMEHLVLDFEDDSIEKLGNHDFFESNELNNNNIIIKTPKFFGWKRNNLREYSRLDHKNTQWKEFNSRAPDFLNNDGQATVLDRKICAAFPQVPVIDFEIKKIRHCSKKVINGSKQFDITRDNINKMMTYKLFKFENYCVNCFDSISKRPNEQVLDIMEIME